jgi:hypothetical protein
MVSKAKQDFGKGKEIKIEKVSKIKDSEVRIEDLQGSDTIEDMFRTEQQSNQASEKELFHEKTVKARTDLSVRQIKLITKAFYFAKITGLEKELCPILSDFMTLSISKDRKSRLEYVEALKSRIDNQIQGGMMNVRGQFGK